MNPGKRQIQEDQENGEVDPCVKEQKMVLYNETAEQIRTYQNAQYKISNGSPDLSYIDQNYIKSRLKYHMFEEFWHYKLLRKKDEEEKKESSKNEEKKPAIRKRPSKLKISDFIRNPVYHPADPTRTSTSTNRLPDVVERLRLKKDISMANQEYHAIPIYCDLGFKSTDFCLSDKFSYATKNCVDDPEIDPKGAAIICCTCEDECLPETCECLKLQKKAFGSAIEHLGGGFVRDSFDYWRSDSTINVISVALIMCGPKCRCSEKKELFEDNKEYSTCRNHIDQLRVTSRFEVFRRDIDVGFGIRALNHFEIDEVVSEFVGKVRPYVEVEQDDRIQNYGLEICGEDIQYLMDKIVKSCPDLTDDKLNLYKTNEKNTKIHKRKKNGRPKKYAKEPIEHWFIDPHGYGNLSRFFSHGCFGNIVPFRVIVNHLHPHYHRVFFKAIVPIPAGTELVFNYGEDYINRANFTCKCRTLMCRGEPEKVNFWKSLGQTKTVNLLASIADHYQSVIKEKTQFYKDHESMTSEYKGIEEAYPSKKKPAREPDRTREYNAKNREIYGNLVEGRDQRYKQDQENHFKKMEAEYLSHLRMVKEMEEHDKRNNEQIDEEDDFEPEDEDEEEEEDMREQEEYDDEDEELSSGVEDANLDD